MAEFKKLKTNKGQNGITGKMEDSGIVFIKQSSIAK